MTADMIVASNGSHRSCEGWSRDQTMPELVGMEAIFPWVMTCCWLVEGNACS